jgi:cell division protein FtsB
MMKNKLKIIIFLIIFLVGLAILLFNQYGIIKYLRLKSEVNSLNEQVIEKNNENRKLQGEIDSLRNKVPAKIEQVAREKYGMKRKDEKIIKIQGK